MDFIYESDRVYAMDENSKIIAEINFPKENGVCNINRTFVDESLRGQGVAGKLMEAAVKAIRDQGKKAAATCSYAVKWFEKHPEISDLLK